MDVVKQALLSEKLGGRAREKSWSKGEPHCDILIFRLLASDISPEGGREDFAGRNPASAFVGKPPTRHDVGLR